MYRIYSIRSGGGGGGGGLLFIKINLQTRLLIVTRLRHKSNNKTRPLFTLSLEMTRLVNETRLLLVPCFNSDIYGMFLAIITYVPCPSKKSSHISDYKSCVH